MCWVSLSGVMESSPKTSSNRKVYIASNFKCNTLRSPSCICSIRIDDDVGSGLPCLLNLKDKVMNYIRFKHGRLLFAIISSSPSFPSSKRGPDTQLFVKLAFSARIVTEFTKNIPQNHASYTPYVGGIGLSPCEGIPNCQLLPLEHIQYFHSFPSCAAEGIEPW